MNNITTFLTKPEFAKEFFERCSLLKEDTRENRMQLWKQMVQELKAIGLTKQDLKRYVKGKRIGTI